MIFRNKKRIKELELENTKLKETILDMSAKISWCEDKILELRSDTKRKAREEWTLDNNKKRVY